MSTPGQPDPDPPAWDRRRWAEVLEATEHLGRPCHLPGAFSQGPFEEEMLTEVLRDVAASVRAGVKLQIFAQGGRREDHRERAIASPPRPHEPIDAWLRRLFPGEPIGVKLGNLEVIDGAISRTVAELLAPLLEQVGLPSAGVSLGAFIGQYALTPFGIHHDPLTYVFHAHLRGNKRIYFWSPEAYAETNGDLRYRYDVRPAHLDSAEWSFELGPGSLLYFPGAHYHIAASPEFSVALALILNHHCRRDVLRSAATALLRERFGAGAEMARGPLERRITMEGVEDVEPTARQWLSVAIADHRRRLCERGALERPATITRSRGAPPKE